MYAGMKMKSGRFERIVIIGYGKIAGDILIYLNNLQESYNFFLEFIEHEIQQFSVVGEICREKKIICQQILNKEELVDYLGKIQEITLIISANNNFLFPKEIVKKENLVIINYHNALLPAYPGRNASSWVIYKGEEITGITWHYVTGDIDAGNIICQKQYAIRKDMKAYELSGILMKLAFEGFQEIFTEVFRGLAVGSPQCITDDRRIYHSWEVPGDGRFSLKEPPCDIYRLLRSTDYGKINIFSYMRTVYRGEEVEIVRYGIINKSKVNEGNYIIYLPYGENMVLKMKYQKVINCIW